MLRHKNIDRVCCIILALTLLVSGLFVGAAATGAITEDTTIGYETRLFDQSRVHTIDIVMNEDDWEVFLDTCTSEEYASCHLVIDGESYKNVAIRGKGNTSLSSVQAYGNDRYSFKVEFDHYQTGHTYHGLDKLSLNNLIQDNTYMKDYFAYTLMNKMDVASPLCSFVRISVNGEYWGLYLAVEGVEDAFLQRNYGKDYGELYKPDSMSFGGGRGNGRDFDMDEMAEKFGFSFGGDGEENQTFTAPTDAAMPDMSDMPAAPDGFEPSGGNSSDMEGSSGSRSASSSTATPEPTPTATPAPMNDASNGESSGDSAGGSSGDAAGASSGMPSVPTDGATPGMGASSGVPATPTDGATPGMGASSGVSATPTDGAIPDMGVSSGMPAAPTDGAMPDMSSMPAMPTDGTMPQMPGGEVPTMPTGGAMPAISDAPAMPEGFDPTQASGEFQMPDMGNFGGGFGSSTDVKLQYSDDDPSSYSNIFDNAKTDITTADQDRLIASLKALGEGDTSVVDTDAVIRYMAVHNFLCNDDSYTGMMVHNYYLYEEDGVLAMIPWDYNLAYGTMSSTNATSSVNTDIDRLVSMGSNSDRPMASWITASEAYMAQYHTIYQEFVTTVFDSGWFSTEIDRVSEMIAPYVESDPTAFCTYEEFQTGVQTLKAFCLKRAESVSNQLSGSNARVDASDMNLSAMGTMGGMGGGFGDRDNGGGFEMPDFGNRNKGATTTAPDQREKGEMPAAPDQTAGTENSAIPTDEFASSSGSQSAAQTTQAPSPAPESLAAPTEEAEATPAQDGQRQQRRSGGEGFDFNAMQPQNQTDGGIWIAACALLLGAALLLAKCYRTNR